MTVQALLSTTPTSGKHEYAGWGVAAIMGSILLVAALRGGASSAPATIAKLSQLAGLDTAGARYATVLLTPADCQGDLSGLARLFSSLSGRGILVRGLVLTPDPVERWADAVEAYRLPIPVQTVAASEVNESLLQLGVHRTPTILLYDRTSGSSIIATIPSGVELIVDALVR
jgi:hypothetical protein